MSAPETVEAWLARNVAPAPLTTEQRAMAARLLRTERPAKRAAS